MRAKSIAVRTVSENSECCVMRCDCRGHSASRMWSAGMPFAMGMGVLGDLAAAGVLGDGALGALGVGVGEAFLGSRPAGALGAGLPPLSLYSAASAGHLGTLTPTVTSSFHPLCPLRQLCSTQQCPPPPRRPTSFADACGYGSTVLTSDL